MITREQTFAIFELYSSVVTMQGDVAYDKDNNEVAYDINNVDNKVSQLQAEETAKQQAEVAAKESALSKLTALGLTSDEVKALLGVA